MVGRGATFHQLPTAGRLPDFERNLPRDPGRSGFLKDVVAELTQAVQPGIKGASCILLGEFLSRRLQRQGPTLVQKRKKRKEPRTRVHTNVPGSAFWGVSERRPGFSPEDCRHLAPKLQGLKPGSVKTGLVGEGTEIVVQRIGEAVPGMWEVRDVDAAPPAGAAPDSALAMVRLPGPSGGPQRLPAVALFLAEVEGCLFQHTGPCSQ